MVPKPPIQSCPIQVAVAGKPVSWSNYRAMGHVQRAPAAFVADLVGIKDPLRKIFHFGSIFSVSKMYFYFADFIGPLVSCTYVRYLVHSQSIDDPNGR